MSAAPSSAKSKRAPSAKSVKSATGAAAAPAPAAPEPVVPAAPSEADKTAHAAERQAIKEAFELFDHEGKGVIVKEYAHVLLRVGTAG
jgi:hypothetical protein